MEQVRFNYSMKNIPIPPQNSYLKRLIEKVESVIKRMRWKAFFFNNNTEKTEDKIDDKFGFSSKKCPPQIDCMEEFEADLMNMIQNVKFKAVHDEFQNQLKEDIKKINSSPKAFIPADKTVNYYKLDKSQHDKLLHNSISSTYKKASKDAINSINYEAKEIATELNIANRTERIATKQAFITLKDHKENFANKPTCRLINPAKNDLGSVSKSILDKINDSIRQQTSLHQWRNSTDVINWFNRITDKNKHSFAIFDIDNFYPSISENLLLNAINYAKKFTPISNQDIDIIMHCRKSLLFDNDIAWEKKNNKNLFDVTMGSYDGAEACELVGLFILNTLCEKLGNNNIGLYRDDGLALLKNTSGPQAERTKKVIIKHFKEHGLNITIRCNLKIVDFLDVTLNLKNGTFCPYRKPNNDPIYINAKSNHPPTIIKHLPDSINRRISSISSNEEVFNQAKPIYENALKSSGYDATLSFDKHNSQESSDTTTPHSNRKNRKRQIIWFNPPFSRNVHTKVGRIFLSLIQKHFPKSHPYHKIFNKNTVKVSYSCMDNMNSIIRRHNQKVLNTTSTSPQSGCNCRKKQNCPLDNNCLSTNVIYNAKITTEDDPTGKNYIGLTEGPFKQRYTQHTLSFRKRNYANSTELSKYIWSLKDSNKDFSIEWSTLCKAAAYNNKTKKCNLCLAEKFQIIKADKSSLLNKRSELISKCRHENKFYLLNFKFDTP